MMPRPMPPAPEATPAHRTLPLLRSVAQLVVLALLTSFVWAGGTAIATAGTLEAKDLTKAPASVGAVAGSPKPLSSSPVLGRTMAAAAAAKAPAPVSAAPRH